MKKFLSILMALILLATLIPVATAEEAGTVTVLMYMCGTDLQSDCLADMREMCSSEKPDNVTIVVQAGGANTWDDSRLTPNTVNRFLIQYNDMQDIEDIGSQSMGDPETLIDFLDYGISNYPADRYMVVMWDHGGGATGGICYDQTDEDDCLTGDEITYALYQNRTRHPDFMFDIIGFDACLMATYEFAMQICDYGRYMVASEELEPYLGWNYEWLNAFADNPGIETGDWAKAIVDAYYEACMADNPNDYVSLSAVYLPAMLQVNACMEQFSQYLVQALEAGELGSFSRARQNMYAFGEFDKNSSDMVDMMAFIDAFRSIAPNTASRLESALGRAVEYSLGSDMFDYLSGLSILFPMDTRGDFDNYIQYYDYNGFYPNYTDFIKGYTALLNGGSYRFAVQAPDKVDGSEIASPAFQGSLTQAVYSPTGSFVADEGDSGDAPQESALPSPTPTAAPFIFTPFTGNGASGGAGTDAQTTAAPPQEAFQANGLPASYDPNTAYAYTLSLSSEDLQNLSNVEGNLFIDISDDDGAYYIDLGYVQNAWIDWQNAEVYSLFDGRWPMMEGQLVAMYDQVKTNAMRRSVIPVLCNGVEGYLAVLFNSDAPGGKIIGFSAGYDQNGLPVRGLTELKEGDVITPRYQLVYFDDAGEQQEASFEGDPITLTDPSGIDFGYESMEGSETTFLYCFRFNDIFGGTQTSDFVAFDL